MMSDKFKLRSVYILFFSSLFLIWNIISYLINFISYEGLISSFRIFISSIIVLLFYRLFSLKKILKFVFFIGLFNSLLVAVQVYDSIFSEILPVYLKYGYFYKNAEFVDSFRMGGLMISLQISSFLALVSILISYKYFSKYIFVLLPVFSFPIVFGSRTILVIWIILMLYNIYKFRKSSILFFLILISVLNIPEFKPFIELRLEPIYKITTSGDLNQDYSLSDTKTHYNFDLLDVKTFMFGNGYDRYSNLGGKDPFYTRWVIQTGFLGFLIIFTFILYLIGISNFTLFTKFLILFVFLITSFKSELFTSTMIFPFFLFFILKSRNQ